MGFITDDHNKTMSWLNNEIICGTSPPLGPVAGSRGGATGRPYLSAASAAISLSRCPSCDATAAFSCSRRLSASPSHCL